MTINGKEAPWIIRWQLAGWGMSEVEKMVEAFNLFIRTDNVLYEILDEAKVDIYKFNGLNEQLISSSGTQKINARVALANQAKNFQNALILDKEDDYEQKQLSFSGLAEIKKENRIALASALRIPMTKLFGLSAAGLESGETDLENYNCMVESDIREEAKPVIHKLLPILSQFAHGDEYDIKFKFYPLRILGAVEQEAEKTSKQNRYLALYDRQIIDSQELAQMLHKDGMMPIETQALKGNVDPHPMPVGGGFGSQPEDEEKYAGGKKKNDGGENG
jgi:phage-related protein (TIGR01555 family)